VQQEIDAKTLEELEEKFDPEMRFRPLVPPATLLVAGLLITLSCFHYYTAGFGLLRETTHRGIHLAFVLGLIFLTTVVPIGLLMRAFGHDPLRLKREPQAPSYWVQREPPGPAPETMIHQF